VPGGRDHRRQCRSLGIDAAVSLPGMVLYLVDNAPLATLLAVIFWWAVMVMLAVDWLLP
jgi:hypothetical protein